MTLSLAVGSLRPRRPSDARLADATFFAREAEALAKARLCRACARSGKERGNVFMEYRGKIVAEGGDDLGGSGRGVVRLYG